MVNYKLEIQKKISDILATYDIHNLTPEINHPTLSRGDFTTNIAMVMAQKLKKSPLLLANEVAQEVRGVKWVGEVDVVEPGFINIKLDETAYVDFLNELLISKQPIIYTDNFKNKKIIIEFTDPNPFKELHIGHLYSNIIGESISRILENGGAEVTRVCYQGDVGLHVAKSIWGMQQLLNKFDKNLSEIGNESLSSRVKFLGDSYVLGSNAYVANDRQKAEIKHY